MGVLRDEDKKKRIEELTSLGITYADYVFDDSSSDEDDIVVVEIANSEEEERQPDAESIRRQKFERRMNRRNAQKSIRQADKLILRGNPELHVKKNMGAQKWRRIENARILAQFADANDIRFDCSDLVEETMTAFARLMNNEAAMRAWNEFIEKDEDEQNKYLEELDKELAGRFEPSMSAIDDPNEKRSYHPGYSAKSCFQRMDKEFKKALSKKSGVRMELIDKLETEFRKFFGENPSGVWSDSINSTQKRFYLHAVAQFLMLRSNSQQNPTLTTVDNPRKKFEPPRETLYQLLSKKQDRNMIK